MNTLKLENVTFSYDNKTAIIENINVIFNQGTFYSIIGESGAGKTTLLSIIAGLEKPSDGEVLWNNKNINKMGLCNYRNEKISIIFQNYNLINYLNILDNVLFSMEIKHAEGNKKSKAISLLESVGIDKNQFNKFPQQLSGGQQQRVAIARALASDVDFIIADEPTGNLDKTTANEIINIMKNLVTKLNKTLILVTHDPQIAKQADKIFEVKDHHLVNINLT